MKIITLTEEEFDNFSSKHKYNTYFQSSLYAHFAKTNDQYNIHYLGFVDNDKLIGASLMLYKTLFMGYKYAYAPRGLLIDYEDHKMVNTISKALKGLLKKQKFIFVTIDPPIVASERDTNGKIKQFNNDVNRILSDFKNNNYEHLGFNLYNESILPRWNVIARLNRDGRTLFNNFSDEVKDKLSHANNISLSVNIDNDLNIDIFYEFVKKGIGKSNKKYFQNLYDTFGKNNKMRIFYAKINTKKYAENVNKLYTLESDKNIELANIIQNDSNATYDMTETINKKLESDKMLNIYKKDVVASTKLLKNNPDGITCGAALTIEDARGVNILINYVDPDYTNYNPETVLTYEIMKYYGKMDYKYINIGAVTGNFDSTSKYYSLLESKLGFNSSILEYVGQFNIVLNPLMYRIYKKKYNK